MAETIANRLAAARAAGRWLAAKLWWRILNPLPDADSERLLALDYGIPTRNAPSGVQVMTCSCTISSRQRFVSGARQSSPIRLAPRAEVESPRLWARLHDLHTRDIRHP